MAAQLAAAAVASPPEGQRRIVATTSLAPCPSVEYEWRLEGVTQDFFTAAAVGHKLESPPFSAQGVIWTLWLYPNGRKTEDQGCVSLHLSLQTEDVKPSVQATLRFGVEEMKLARTNVFNTCTPRPEGAGRAWGCSKFLPHAKLRAKFAAFAPGGVLTVRCTLGKGGKEERTSPSTPVPASTLAADLAAALQSGTRADVTLLCGDERVAAHALVLCARSPVFAAQLNEGPLQADASAVPVPPEITPHTLRRLLDFLYTDELEPASPEEATHLLNAADHYGVRRLFAICERTLCSALAVENAPETLTLADQHGAAALKDAALRFVAANAVAVMATPGWTHLLSSRPTLIAEALHTLATGAPPEPPARLASAADASGEADAAGAEEGTAQRLCERAR
jgi:speckle-type POZ protein